MRKPVFYTAGVILLAAMTAGLSVAFQPSPQSAAAQVAQQPPSPHSGPPPGSKPPPPRVVQNPEALPVCAGGPNLASGSPPANPGFCRAPAARPGRPFNNAYPGPFTRSGIDDQAAATDWDDSGDISVTAAQAYGPYYWGGPIGTFSHYGVYAAIEVTDPDVPVCPYPCPPSNEAHYTSRVMSRALNSIPEIEIGWAEAGYDTLVAGAHPQEIFVEYATGSGARTHDWLTGYPIAPGDWIYVATVGGGGIWQAQLWWNNQWNVIRSVSFDLPTPAPREEAFGEVLSPSGLTFNASGTLDQVQVATAPGVWAQWNTALQPTDKVSCPPYAVNYGADYYWFQFYKSANVPAPCSP